MIKISTDTHFDIAFVTLKGTLNASATGHLSDVLTGFVTQGWRKIFVDLSVLQSVTRAGGGPLVVAAKLLRTRRGETRICNAAPPTEVFLKTVSFRHLLTFDADRPASLKVLSPQSQQAAKTDANLPCSGSDTAPVPREKRRATLRPKRPSDASQNLKERGIGL